MDINLLKNDYPKFKNLIDRTQLDVRLMVESDIDNIVKYFSHIPRKEALYYRVNMFEKESLQEYWDTRVKKGKSVSLIGTIDNEIVGIVSLHIATAPGSSHVGYIRLSVSPFQRSKGIASILAHEIFNSALILKLEKVCAEIVAGQDVAKTIFEKKLGFKEEAIRIDHVKDSKGKYHNLIILYNNTKRLVEDILRRAVFSSVIYGQEH